MPGEGPDHGAGRRRGLGGRPFDSSSPLFGGPNGGSVPAPTEPATVDPLPVDEDTVEAIRDLLPAIEQDRNFDDWGRSESFIARIEPLLDFYYRHWFRVEVDGIGNVPSEGGALLVSNHSGALPPDAPMIMQAIRNEHPRPRPVYMLVEHWFKGYPGVSMLAARMGLVPAHPENAQRLLHDESQLAIVFPEGQKGSRKLSWQRYRLRRFGRGGFVRTAARAGVPIVPVAVIGAEESMPIFAHFRALEKLTGLIYFPLTPTFPHFGLAAALMYLPAKFRICFLDPIEPAELPADLERDPAAVQAVAELVRGRIQERLDRETEARGSVWTG